MFHGGDVGCGGVVTGVAGVTGRQNPLLIYISRVMSPGEKRIKKNETRCSGCVAGDQNPELDRLQTKNPQTLATLDPGNHPGDCLRPGRWRPGRPPWRPRTLATALDLVGNLATPVTTLVTLNPGNCPRPGRLPGDPEPWQLLTTPDDPDEPGLAPGTLQSTLTAPDDRLPLLTTVCHPPGDR
eukprot:6175478-Pleurochrysis_carterae.AAC.1